MYVCMYGIV